MRASGLRRSFAHALAALALAALPAAGVAVVPLLIGLGKQIVQDMVLNAVRHELIGSLAGMGCKGARLAGLIATASAIHGAGGLGGGFAGMARGGMAGAGGVPMPPGMPAGAPGMPAGMPSGAPAMPTGMPSGAPGMPTGAAGMPAGAAGMPAGMPAGAAGMPGAMRGVPAGGPVVAMQGGGPDMSQMMAVMQARSGMTPEQMARTQETMAKMQRAMEHPLTRPETLEVFAELKGLGLLTDAMHDEARDCVLLAPMGSDRALGQTGAVVKELILPQLRETKARLASLGPDEQEELARGIAEALREASPADRKVFDEGLGLGFFPKAVVERARTAAR